MKPVINKEGNASFFCYNTCMGKNVNEIKLVAFDLDGTVLPSGGSPGTRDVETLNLLGDLGVYRVMATGRSLFSLRKVIKADFPVDYVIFSSGAGIIDWKRGEIFNSSSLESGEIRRLFNIFKDIDLDFMVHMPVPENHNFYYYTSGKKYNQDFERRMEVYKPYSNRINCESLLPSEAAQFLAVLPPEEVDSFASIRSECEGFSVIRATSPLDGRSIWLEVFPREVSKGCKLELLCNKLGVSRESTVGIGNDYNDLDMLEWVGAAYVVGNSPEDLKSRFRNTDSVYDAGFTRAVVKHMDMQEDPAS